MPHDGRTLIVAHQHPSARLKESAKADNTPATYEIESLDRGCDLPEPRANLQIVDTGNQTLLLLGGHRYDGS